MVIANYLLMVNICLKGQQLKSMTQLMILTIYKLSGYFLNPIESVKGGSDIPPPVWFLHYCSLGYHHNVLKLLGFSFHRIFFIFYFIDIYQTKIRYYYYNT